MAYITLHIGLGTFRPIMVEDLTRHQMDSEYFHVPTETAKIINKAKISPEGDLIALRTYESMQLFELVENKLVPLQNGDIDLRPLLEAQGEGIAIGRDGLLVLTSEAAGGNPPQMNLLYCYPESS